MEYPKSSNLLKSNTLNLNRHTLGQLVNSNTATSRLVHEELLVGGVHFSEVGHISEEDLNSKLAFHHIDHTLFEGYIVGDDLR